MILTGKEEEKFIETIKNKNVKKVKWILKNSNKNKKILKLKEKDNEYRYCPLYQVIYRNSIKIV